MESFCGTKTHCEECQFYLMIDSAYGFCRRFPPAPIIIRRDWLGRYKYDDVYPTVVFDGSTCGEFLKRKAKNEK